jgi:hypothetical protein
MIFLSKKLEKPSMNILEKMFQSWIILLQDKYPKIPEILKLWKFKSTKMTLPKNPKTIFRWE